MRQMIFHSPVGKLLLTEQGGYITGCVHALELPEQGLKPCAGGILEQASEQLSEYFAGQRRRFELPLEPSGSAFQQAVWRCLQTIPYGETCSYQQLARQLGNPGASRAVGSANGKNPLWIIIPCHRVVRSSGELGGYAGGLAMKEWLLSRELEVRQTS
jgi:methylated-DNA-[protein]-cysteine S-methyltransferase